MTTKFSKDDTLAIKGVALLFLLHHHNFCQYVRFENYQVNFLPFESDSVVHVAAFFKICVGMFAFLSAYGLTLSLKKYNKNTCISSSQFLDYFGKRCVKLMWGFWFAYLFSCVVCAILKPEHFELYYSDEPVRTAFYVIYDFFGLAHIMGTPTLNGTWWYMSLALFIVMATPFAAKLVKKYGFFFTTMLVIFVPRLVSVGSKFAVGESTNIVRWSYSVALGVYFAQNNTFVKMKDFSILKNKIANKLLKLVIATALLVSLYNIYILIGGKFANYCYEFRDCFIPVFVIYYFYDFIVDIPGLRQTLMFIGKHSMNIFFTHTFIRVYIFEAFTYSFGHFLLIDLVLLLDSIAVSVVMELLKKPLKYDSLMNKVLSVSDKRTKKEMG